jgi:hypothetical protein
MVDCVIFSTGRAASTSIYRYLDEMCALSLPANKEPHYWLEGVLDYKRIPDVLREIYVADLRNYERLYQGARLSVDASVGYYHYAEKVAARIRDSGSVPKIIMLVREPMAWARSLHMENLYQSLEHQKSLENCLAEDRTDPDLWWQLRYRDIRYREVYETLTATFPEVMLINYDKFRIDVDGMMREICGFLDLDVVTLPSGEVHHSSRARANQIRFRSLKRFGEFFPTTIRLRVARLLFNIPLCKMAPIRDEILAEAMSKSIVSYNELWELVAEHERMRQFDNDGKHPPD